MVTKFFRTFLADTPLLVELKTNGGLILVTILLHFHHFISLETAKTQKSEVFLLRISFGNVMHQLLIPDILKFAISVLEKNF